jgi:hypothetical protein
VTCAGATTYGNTPFLHLDGSSDEALMQFDNNVCDWKMGASGTNFVLYDMTDSAIALTVDTSRNATFAGNVTPSADNTKDLGTSALRWANLYVGDMQLNNEGGGGNEVDGTEGSWTIQEGEEDLFVINRKTGKKFKMKLEEI